MKKLSSVYKKLSLLIICTSLLLVSCASKNKKAEADFQDSEQEVTQTENESSSKKHKKKNKKNKKNKQNYVGWINTDNHPVSNDIGIIRLRAIPSLGSFNICAVTEKDKAYPVLSSTNEYASSSFYLYTERKIYRLTASSGVSTKAVKTETGMTMNYQIKNVADVTVNFDCFSSVEDVNPDMVKVTATITNLSARKSKYGLKAVLDTVLGESYRNHFYTSAGIPVKNERQFVSNQEENSMDRWIVSRNSNAALQIFFDGADTTRVEQVQLASYSTLDTKNWYPNLTSFRAFDTVTAYNNSSVGINWPVVSISPDEKREIVFYMALALDEQLPKGEVFLYPEEYVPAVENTEAVEAPVSTPAPVLPVTSVPAPVVEVPAVKKEVTVETPKPHVTVNKVVEASEAVDVPNVKFDVSSLTAEQLEPEYIQNLINRITVLEESGLAVNRAELLQLNAELDAILEILRKN